MGNKESGDWGAQRRWVPIDKNPVPEFQIEQSPQLVRMVTIVCPMFRKQLPQAFRLKETTVQAATLQKEVLYKIELRA